MMTSLFLCHGGPTLALEDNEYTEFLKSLGSTIKPKAIVIFTAHFESEVTTISYRDDCYSMIYDFYGFPRELYSLEYKATGSKDTALTVQRLLSNSGIESKFDYERGLDHGSWVILKLMYPMADIPVVQVSVNPNLSMEKQYELGKALRELGQQDILLIGSGATVHNLGTIDWNAKDTKAWALLFDDWLIKNVAEKNLEKMFEYRQVAPMAKTAVPTEEHITPLFIAMGSGQEEATPELLHRSYEFGTLSYIGLKF